MKWLDPIHRLFQIDPNPKLSWKKFVRLVIKAFIFALSASTLQYILVVLGVPYAKTVWMQAGLLLLLYIPFFRWINAEFMYKPVQKDTKTPASDAKYAGVRKKGPKFK